MAELKRALDLRGRNWERFRRLLKSFDLLLSPTMQFTAMTVADWDAAWKNPDRWEPHSNFAPVYTSHTMMFNRSEEHTSELQSLMRISYAVFCLKKKNHTKKLPTTRS